MFKQGNSKKNDMRFYLMLVRMAFIKKNKERQMLVKMQGKRSSFTAGNNIN
jgi:hypothetical protein